MTSEMVGWGSYDLEAAEDEAKELEKGQGGDIYKWQAGDNVMRALPPPQGQRSPFQKSKQHYVEKDHVPGATKVTVLNCPGAGCPLCHEAARLKSSPNPLDQEAGKRMSAKERYYANMIVRGQEEVGPQIVAFGRQVYSQLVELRKNETKGGDFCDPGPKGFDLVITKKGEKLTTEYTVGAARACSSLGDLGWIEMQHDLSRLTQVPTLDQVRAKLAGDGSHAAIGEARGPANARPIQAQRLPAATSAAPGSSRAGSPNQGTKPRTAADDMKEPSDIPF